MKTVRLHPEGASIARHSTLDRQVDGPNGISTASIPNFRNTRTLILRTYLGDDVYRTDPQYDDGEVLIRTSLTLVIKRVLRGNKQVTKEELLTWYEDEKVAK